MTVETQKTGEYQCPTSSEGRSSSISEKVGRYGPWLADGSRATTDKQDEVKIPTKPIARRTRRGRRKSVNREKVAAAIREYGQAGAARLMGISLMTAYRVAKEYHIPQLARGTLNKQRREKLLQAMKEAGK